MKKKKPLVVSQCGLGGRKCLALETQARASGGRATGKMAGKGGGLPPKEGKKRCEKRASRYMLTGMKGGGIAYRVF